MGRLKKLRIEATKKANEALADRQKREVRAKKEVDNTETARNATKDDVFSIIGIERAKSTPGILQMISEAEVSGEEVKCSEVEKCKHHPFALSDGTNSGLMEDDFVYLDGDLYFIAGIKDTQLSDQESMKDAVELFGKEKGNRKYISYRDFKKYATTRGKQGSDARWWISISDESDWDNEGDSQYTNLYLSRGGVRHLNWYLDEKSPMNEEINRMNDILHYDVTKTREENTNETLRGK